MGRPGAILTDLAEFLRARLDEDETAAPRSQSLRDKLDDPHRQITADVRNGAEYAWREIAVNPGRLLREVEAKRAIVGRHAPYPEHPAYCGYCNDGLLEQHWPCPDVLDIAAIYSDHPGYRQEWKP